MLRVLLPAGGLCLRTQGLQYCPSRVGAISIEACPARLPPTQTLRECSLGTVRPPHHLPAVRQGGGERRVPHLPSGYCDDSGHLHLNAQRATAGVPRHERRTRGFGKERKGTARLCDPVRQGTPREGSALSIFRHFHGNHGRRRKMLLHVRACSEGSSLVYIFYGGCGPRPSHGPLAPTATSKGNTAR